MSYATNLKGEQGGVFLTDGESFTSTGEKDYALGFQVLEDTILSAITMDGFGGTESVLVGETLDFGTYIAGSIVSLTVTTGIVQMLKH